MKKKTIRRKSIDPLSNSDDASSHTSRNNHHGIFVIFFSFSFSTNVRKNTRKTGSLILSTFIDHYEPRKKLKDSPECSHHENSSFLLLLLKSGVCLRCIIFADLHELNFTSEYNEEMNVDAKVRK